MLSAKSVEKYQVEKSVVSIYKKGWLATTQHEAIRKTYGIYKELLLNILTASVYKFIKWQGPENQKIKVTRGTASALNSKRLPQFVEINLWKMFLVEKLSSVEYNQTTMFIE